MTALSTASPYSTIKVGSGQNSVETGEIRFISGREQAFKGELNPKFLQVFELDAKLPEDWKLEVSIKDKGLMAYSDGLIGTTVIDLENRLFSSPL